MILRQFIHRAMRTITLLLFGVLGWGGWYLHYHGLGKAWRDFVCEEFRKRGVELSMERLTLDPMEGLVAREVHFGNQNDLTKAVASINRLALDLNITNLIQHLPFLTAVDLRDAELILPLDSSPGSKQPLIVRKLNARILFPPQQIYVSHAEAEVLGIHVTATGRLNNPKRFQLQAGDQKEPAKTPVFTRVLHEFCEKVKFATTPPKLQVRFSGDLAEPEKIFAEATLFAPAVRLPGYSLEEISARVTLQDGVCSLEHLTARDGKGMLEARGDYRVSDRSWEGQLRSNLQLSWLFELLHAPAQLKDLHFFTPPLLEVAASSKSGFKLTGKIALGKFAFGWEEFESLDCSFSMQEKDWYVRDLRLLHNTGEVTVSAMQLPGDFRARLLSTINPRAFAPMLSGKAASILGEWEFIQAPQATLNVTGTSPNILNCETIGHVRLGQTRLRGIPLKAATATMRIKDQAISYENFRVEREEGIATGSFTYDFARHEVRLNQIKTHLVPTDVAQWIDLRLVKDVSPYKFKSPPNLSINGVVQTHGGKQTHLEILVEGPDGMDYVFLKKNLTSQKISGKLLFTDGRLRISNLHANLYSGTLRGSADISLRREDQTYTAQMEVENIDFPKITKIYFNYETAKGELTGKYSFSGRGDNARVMQGVGELRVNEGNVFAIPLFGPLSGMISTILPGVGYDMAHEAKASFQLSKGVIDTKNFLVKGRGFSMMGNGKLFFLDDKIDFDLRINAQGVPGAILFPVSKLFEYKGEGSLSKPSWQAKRIPGI